MTPKELLDTILGYLGFVVQIDETQSEGGNPTLQIYMEESHTLIGRDGETLEAIQFLLNRLIQAKDKDAPKGHRRGSVPRLQYRILQAVYAEPRASDSEPIATVHCCSLLELSEQRCRWPISTPGADDFCFCGNTPVEGLPYCPGHTRLAYRPGSRQRVARG